MMPKRLMRPRTAQSTSSNRLTRPSTSHKPVLAVVSQDALLSQVFTSQLPLFSPKKSRSILYHDFSMPFLSVHDTKGKNETAETSPTRKIKLTRPATASVRPVPISQSTTRIPGFVPTNTKTKHLQRPQTAVRGREASGRNKADEVYRKRAIIPTQKQAKKIKRSALEEDMERHGKVLAVENKRCFVNDAEDQLLQEKSLLGKVIKTYKVKLIDNKRRQAEDELRKKEKFLELLDNAVVDIDKLAAIPFTISKKSPDNKKTAKIADENKEETVTSKYQSGFQLDIQMRHAFNKNFAVVDPEEKVKRLRKISTHLSTEALEVKKEAIKIKEKLQLQYQSKVSSLLKATKKDLCNLAMESPSSGVSEDFFEAVKEGDELMVKFDLARNPALVFEVDKYKATPLHWACKRGHFEIIKLLIEAGADVHALDIFKRTPKEIAKKHKHWEVIRHIIQN